MKKFYVLLFGLAFLQGTAYAEMIQGTVMNVDGNKLMLRRIDTNEEITVSVKDQGSLGQVQTGSQITLDANKGMMGGWKASSVSPADASLNGASGDIPSPEVSSTASEVNPSRASSDASGSVASDSDAGTSATGSRTASAGL